jgi:hypothetical protein
MSERSDTVIPIGPQKDSESDITSSSNYFRNKFNSLRRGNLSNKSTEAREESFRDNTPQKKSIKEGSGEDRREFESKSDRGENEVEMSASSGDVKQGRERDRKRPEKKRKTYVEKSGIRAI